MNGAAARETLDPNDALAAAAEADAADRGFADEEATGELASVNPSIRELSDTTVAEIWQQAVTSMSGLLADNAACAARVAISAPHRLVATFPAKYNACKVFCERPANLAELEQQLARTVGRPVRVEFALAADEKSTETRSSASPRQKREELAKQPFVRKAIDLFQGRLD